MSKRRKRRIIISGDGPLCPRCYRPMQVREHERITEKHLRQPHFFTRWYCCMERRCPTKLVMDERFMVINNPCPTPPEPHPVVWGDSWDDVDQQLQSPPW